jgi:hypothetical protein
LLLHCDGLPFDLARPGMTDIELFRQRLLLWVVLHPFLALGLMLTGAATVAIAAVRWALWAVSVW